MRLKDKIAVVTGGGGGVGEGICLRLAEEGAHVIVCDLDQELSEKVVEKIHQIGRKSIAVRTDVRRADECRSLIDDTVEKMGHIDILVCGAAVNGFTMQGYSGEPAILENISEKEWNLTIDVNLKGVFLCNQAVAPHFKKQKSGKIINLSSLAGRRGADFIPHYSASKAGVIILTQSVALQLAPFNVNVNTICPGVIWTPMTRDGSIILSNTYPQFKGMGPEEVFEAMVDTMIPMKRAQTPSDIGNAVVFLASSEANQITGQAINVDGGMMMN